MSPRYMEACSEVDYIISRLTKEEIRLIPDKFMELIKKNRAKYYAVNIDLNKPLEGQNLKEETLALLAIIYRKYLASPEKREELEKEYQEKLKQEASEISNIKTETNINVYHNKMLKEEIKLGERSKETLDLMKLEEQRWYMKIINKLKRLFRIK